MIFECHENQSQSGSFENSLESNKRYLDRAETDNDAQRFLAMRAKDKYGLMAIENSDGSFSVLEPYNDQAVAVVKWFRECLDITQIRETPKNLLN